MRNNTQCIILVLVIICTILCVGCQQSTLANNEEQIANPVSDNVVINKLYDEQYYLITEANGYFSYTIYDKDKKAVRTEDGLVKQPKIAMSSSHIVSITGQAGTGIATSYTYYYDVEENQFSPIYQGVLTQRESLIVYASCDKVIIQDVFDNGYYQEISQFREPFASVAFPFVKAELANDFSSICVTYLSGEEYIEVSELFELRSAD